MKTLVRMWVLCLITFIAFSLSLSVKTMAQPRAGVSLQLFYDELEPYGEWINDSQYGSIWVPDVEPNFRPYATKGHWIITEYGNTWVSDYPWGWATFHYGRWIYDDYYGWVWVPDTEWGPAWVSWRSGGGYYGWAPLRPRVSISVGIYIPLNFWVFVPQRHICSPNIYSYYVHRSRNANIYRHTTIINNFYRNNNRSYVYGPRRAEIERVTRSRVPVHSARNYYYRGNSYRRAEQTVGDKSFNRPSRDVTSSRQGNNNTDRYQRPVRSPGFDRNKAYSQNRGENRVQAERQRPDRSAWTNRNNAYSQNRGGNRVQPERQRPDRSSWTDRNNVYSQNRGGNRVQPERQRPDRSSWTDRNNAYSQNRGENRVQPERQQRPDRSSWTDRNNAYSQNRGGNRVQAERQQSNGNQGQYRRQEQVERSRPQRQQSNQNGGSKQEHSRPNRGRSR